MKLFWCFRWWFPTKCWDAATVECQPQIRAPQGLVLFSPQHLMMLLVAIFALKTIWSSVSSSSLRCGNVPIGNTQWNLKCPECHYPQLVYGNGRWGPLSMMMESKKSNIDWIRKSTWSKRSYLKLLPIGNNVCEVLFGKVGKQHHCVPFFSQVCRCCCLLGNFEIFLFLKALRLKIPNTFDSDEIWYR